MSDSVSNVTIRPGFLPHGVDDSLLVGACSRNFLAQAVVEFDHPDRFDHRALVLDAVELPEFLGNLLLVHIGKLLDQEPDGVHAILRY